MPAELGEASHGTLTRPPPAAQAELLALYNASHWPKHLLVQYTWRPLVQVDTAGGLLLVLLGGACKTHRLHTMCELMRQCGACWIAHITPHWLARSGQRLAGDVSSRLPLPASAASLTLGSGDWLMPARCSCGSLAPAVW